MGVKHEKEPYTVATLRVISARLHASANQFESAAQLLEQAGLEIADIRNAKFLRTCLNGVENSAAKASLDVSKSISEAAMAARVKARANQALDAVAKANKRPRKKT
jgi:hypothetical protein